MKLFPILCDASGGQKSKMAAHKQAILISQPAYKITAQFQYCKVGKFNEAFSILCDASKSRKLNMVVHKPGIVISQSVYIQLLLQISNRLKDLESMGPHCHWGTV